MLFWRFLLTVLILVPLCQAEIFTAMADMEHLLIAETSVASVIDQYIYAEKKRLLKLKDFARQYQLKYEAAEHRGMKFLSHPINAFETIKRLTSDWEEVESLMRNKAAQDYLQNITHLRQNTGVRFPVYEDLEGAVMALLRLQDTYKLDTKEISAGRLSPKLERTSPLKAHDCFEIGRIAYLHKDYYHTLMWMEEALARSKQEIPSTANEAEILGYLGFAMSKQGNIKRALKLTRRLLKLKPNDQQAKDNIRYYKWFLEQEGKGKRDSGVLPPLINERPNSLSYFTEEQVAMYESLCRGENYKTHLELSKLHCYYKRDTPFLSIAPFKVEILHFEPKIVLFRDVVSDKEIEIIKELATSKLKRALIVNKETGVQETANYRISKSAWLKDEAHPVIARVSKRIQDMTNLSMTTAEYLQIANYGLGGHYEPHYDMALKDQPDQYGPALGNRIATVLIYLSTPEAGGATVFPDIKLTLFPTKNDAVFWYNIRSSGEQDLSTRHAACPVLAGVKWVSNKWIHERDQEFRRPCALDEMDYE